MNTQIRKLIDRLAAWMSPAATFEAGGLRFRVLSERERTCEVAAGGGRGLREVAIPAKVNRNGMMFSVVAVGRGAFRNMQGLDSVVIPKSVRRIEKEAFSCCFELISVQMQGCVESIGREAFWCCTGLRRFVTMTPKPPKLGRDAFESASLADCLLEVPRDAVPAYKTHSWWRRFRSIEGV